MTVYEVHGLAISVDLDLPSCAIATNGTVDLDVQVQEPATVPREIPDGRLLLSTWGPTGHKSYVGTQEDDGGYRLRLPEAFEATISADLRLVECRLDPAVDQALLSVLVPGILASFILRLQGHSVLHASAVDWNDRAIVFVGQSGMGKSTVAALACDAGARLLSDDVLRVDATADAVTAFRGTLHLRLRNAPQELGLTALGQAGTSADGRAVVAPPMAPRTLPVGVLVIPVPDRSITAPIMDPLNPRDAMTVIREFDHLPGWDDSAVLAHQFETFAHLVHQTPAVVLRVPWGLPFAPHVGAEILAQLSTLTDHASTA